MSGDGKFIDIPEMTLEEQAELERGKIAVKKRSRKTEVRHLEEERDNVKESIVDLRQAVKELRTVLRDTEFDKNLIVRALGDNEAKAKQYKKCSVQDAVKLMDWGYQQTTKYLNSLRHQRNKREEKLLELKERLFETWESEALVTHLEEEQTLKMLENNLQRVQTQTDAAALLRDKYTVMQEALREECRSFPEKIDQLEAAVIKQENELDEFRTLMEMADEDRKKEQQNLEKTTQSTSLDQFQRAMDNKRMRREVTKSADANKKKEGGEADLLETLKERRRVTIAHLDEQKVLEDELLNLESKTRFLANMVGGSTIEDVLRRFQGQADRTTFLSQEKEKAEMEKEKLRNEKLEKELEMISTKYTGAKKTEKVSNAILKKVNRLKKEKIRQEKAQVQLDEKGPLLVAIETSLQQILASLQLPEEEQKEEIIETKSVDATIGEISRRWKKLAKETDNTSTNLKASLSMPESLIDQAAAENIICMVTQESGTEIDFGDDHDENLEAVTRAQLKTRELALVGQKEEPQAALTGSVGRVYRTG